MNVNQSGEVSGKKRWKKLCVSVVVRGVLSVLFGLFLHVLFEEANWILEIFYYRVMCGLLYALWLLWSVAAIVCLAFGKRTVAANIIGGSLCFLMLDITGAIMLMNITREISPEESKSAAIAQTALAAAGDYAPVQLELDPFLCAKVSAMCIESGAALLTEGEETALYVSVEYAEHAPGLVVNTFWEQEQARIEQYSPFVEVDGQWITPDRQWVTGTTENGTEYQYLYIPLDNSLDILMKNTAQNRICSVCLDLPQNAAAIESQAVAEAVVEALEA